ncbi:hypothetical protein T265_06004 [Opisthorchis viverrini]|uniref:Uncharacterized protein n=1 Tax=Opisthorchis viverrini TaxID=6198 RepID=A0A074ZHV7_OPIVI|nr:hypothetical protein T265_06004 [Opisthorchis viverrini]KER26873.1 hypothetical protein T265_06004 [Opisthorchis viverrini]
MAVVQRLKNPRYYAQPKVNPGNGRRRGTKESFKHIQMEHDSHGSTYLIPARISHSKNRVFFNGFTKRPGARNQLLATRFFTKISVPRGLETNLRVLRSRRCIVGDHGSNVYRSGYNTPKYE